MDAFYLKICGGHRRALPIYDSEADRKDIVLELYRKVVPDLQPLWVSLQIGAALSSCVGAQKTFLREARPLGSFTKIRCLNGSTFSKYRQNATV